MGLQQTSIPYNDRHYPYYYLCNYLPLSAGKDTLSHSLLKFKRGRQPDLNGWIDCSLEMLLTPSIPPDSFIIRALHHEETLVPQYPHTSLDKLGAALAQQLKSHYHPRLLRKSFPTQEIKGLTREQREARLQDLYIIDQTQLPIPPSPIIQNSTFKIQNNPHPPSFLIIDDILTTGTTMKMIIGAILRVYPTASLTLFTLAKADYDISFNRSVPLRGQNYQLGQDSSQTVAEEETPYSSTEEEIPYPSTQKEFPQSPEQLKARIRSDTF